MSSEIRYYAQILWAAGGQACSSIAQELRERHSADLSCKAKEKQSECATQALEKKGWPIFCIGATLIGVSGVVVLPVAIHYVAAAIFGLINKALLVTAAGILGLKFVRTITPLNEKGCQRLVDGPAKRVAGLALVKHFTSLLGITTEQVEEASKIVFAYLNTGWQGQTRLKSFGRDCAHIVVSLGATVFVLGSVQSMVCLVASALSFLSVGVMMYRAGLYCLFTKEPENTSASDSGKKG